MHFSSRTIWRTAALLLVCASAAMPTPGTVTYQFVGQCQDCTGTGTGLLVLQNYTLGDAISSSNFVSFTYSSNLINFSLSSGELENISGSLPVSLPGTADLNLSGGNSINKQLLTQLTSPGAWCAGAICSNDFGSSHTWSLFSTAPTATAPVGTPALTDTMLLCLAAGVAVMGGILLTRRTVRSI